MLTIDTGTMSLKQTACRLAAVAVVAMAVLLAAGCGSEKKTAATTAADSGGMQISRPEPGTVEVTDPVGDAVTDQNQVITAATWIDITGASISKSDQGFTFRIKLADVLPPAKPESLVGAEWGFLLDTDGDGEPDWGIYAALPKDKYLPGLYNMKTKERLGDQDFPGTYLFEGATLSWTLPAESIGSPRVFNWIAYSDAGGETGGEGGGLIKIGDNVPDDAWPNGANWLSYP